MQHDTSVPDPSERPTLTLDETAPILGISRDSAYKGAAAGEIPTIRIGRRLLVPTAALRRLLGLDVQPAAHLDRYPTSAA
jgi:excisionase family DNA binding protein